MRELQSLNEDQLCVFRLLMKNKSREDVRSAVKNRMSLLELGTIYYQLDMKGLLQDPRCNDDIEVRLTERARQYYNENKEEIAMPAKKTTAGKKKAPAKKAAAKKPAAKKAAPKKGIPSVRGYGEACKDVNAIIGPDPDLPVKGNAEEMAEALMDIDYDNGDKPLLKDSTITVLEYLAKENDGFNLPWLEAADTEEEEEEEEEAPAQKAPAAKKKAAAKPAAKKPAAKKAAPKKAPKKGGVIASIIEALEKGPKTHKQLHAMLVKKFPDRKPESMLNTIRVQVPGRINRERDFSLEKDDKGRFSIVDVSTQQHCWPML
jgi:hypothetical protein